MSAVSHGWLSSNKRHITQNGPRGQIEGNAIVCYIWPVICLLIATDNLGKRREYRQLLAPLPLKLCSPQELGLELHVQENGGTYSENARLKAVGYQRASGLLTLADDSGLEVDALGGKPGLRSARQGGPDADDVARYRLLLKQLQGVPWEKRTARFRCAIVVATPEGETYHAKGACEGMIAYEPRGEHGFGYDPVFHLPEYGQTMGELDSTTKNRISHRARAAQDILPILAGLLTAQSSANRIR